MCGIFGAIADDVSRETLQTIGAGLLHRGPDDRGLEVWPAEGVALGHTRLSIIDLSEAGRNPMANEDGTVWVTFNGEIYNHRALRQELEQRGHVFRSRTDTEVLVHAYEEWADDHVARLRGMFAYALYDRRQRAGRRGRLLLVRDRIGIKPLYYYTDARRFIFASELAPLLSVPGLSTAIDHTAVADYLTYRYVPAPGTHVQRIRKLQPGTTLELRDGGQRLRPYWSLAASPRRELRAAAAAHEAVAERLESAVVSHLVSDVRVGVLLSGGIDSSAVATVATAAGASDLASFTLGFDVKGKEDADSARLVATRLGTEHHEGTATQHTIQDMPRVIARLYGEPFADGSAIPMREVCRLARRHVKVVLSGDGGDELFGGYTHYRRWFLRQVWFGGVPGRLRRAAVSAVQPWLVPGGRRARVAEVLARDAGPAFGSFLELFTPREKRLLAGPALAAALRDYDDHWLFRRYWRADLDPMTRMQYVDFHTFLVDDILTKIDRASMSFGLEVRPALLDHELVELVFAIPAETRSGLCGVAGKRLLKDVLRGRLPEGVLARRKSGFGAPLDSWLAAGRDRLLAGLRNGALVNLGVLSRSGLQQMSPRLHGLRLWALLVLEECLAPSVAPTRPEVEPCGSVIPS